MDASPHDASGGPHPPEALKLELPLRSTKLPPRKKRKPGTPGKRRRPPPGKPSAPHPPQPPAPRRRRARARARVLGRQKQSPMGPQARMSATRRPT